MKARDTDLFRLLVESVSDHAVIALDPAGVVMSWNDGARRITGYESAEIVGTPVTRLSPPEETTGGWLERELARAAAEGCVENECWRRRKDGSRFWARVTLTALRDPPSGALRGYGQVTCDLSDWRHAEDRLRYNEEQFRLLVQEVEEYAIFMLDPEGHVTTWNTGAEKIKGYAAEEILGAHFGRFYLEVDRAAGLPEQLLAEARARGHARHQGLRVRRDRTTFVADVVITAMHDGGGRLRGFSKVTRDISEQVRRRELEAAKLAAERASRAKDDFLAVLSHELRTPLTPVLATSTYLMENGAELSFDELLEGVRAIRRNVLLEAQIIDDLLDLTRISRDKVELRLEAVDLHQAVRDVIAIVRNDAGEKGIDLGVELEAAAPWTWGDGTRLRQVLWNLLSNAVKFTPAQGRVRVRTRSAEGRLVLEIEDSGVGVEPAHAERIFRAFEQGERTVTRQFGGLGLGLAISRKLVEMHRGTIAVCSEGRGKGAIFTVTLDALREGGSPGAPPPRPTARRQQAVRLLLIDDHADTRRILQRLLARRGHQVIVADSVNSALAAARAGAFDVVISDIGLGDGSGHELMKELRRLLPGVRGIALSGFGMEEDIRKSLEAGFAFHLVKPVDVTNLEEVLLRLGPAE